MKNFKLFFYIVCILLSGSTANAQHIIPMPHKMMACEGSVKVRKLKNVRYVTDARMEDEAYRLDISKKGVTITSATDRGKFYAEQTLQQLAEDCTNGSIACMHIEDHPQYAYRGFMLDVSRHFFSVEELKKLIDVMARYKMNVFHWHLTDDHGWRAEIKKWPKLTTVGSVRSNSWDTDFHLDSLNTTETQKYYTGTTAYTGRQYGPYYYTQDEMRDIVHYCAERHIDVLPEVDMPGHFKAAMAAYPEFSCTPDAEHKVWTERWGVNDDVLNVGNQAAINFAKDILDELCDIFPYPHIHIGGDECPTSAWEKNAMCQEKCRRLGLKHVRALQSDFIKEISDHVQKRGKKIICWNESVSAEGADLELIKQTGATIFCWVGSKAAAKKAIGMGLNVVLSEIHASDGSYYINRRPSAEKGEPTGAGAGDDTVEKTYTYNPLPEGLNENQLKQVNGVQATFWTEWVSSNDYLEYLTLPKLICIAEAGWTAPSQKNWESFRNRLMKQTRWLDENKYIYSQHWMKGYEPRK